MKPRFDSSFVRSSNCMRNHPTYAYRIVAQIIQYTEALQRNNQKQFRRDQFVVNNKQVYDDLADTSEGHSDWMYHLIYSIHYLDEHDHKGWREKN